MIHFISDLHLSPQAPDVARRFQAYLDGAAREAKRLFILGDLFEAWPGDDCIDDPKEPFNRNIVESLRKLVDAGVDVSVMHGNRDFLLGEEFAACSGADLLADPFVLSADGWQFILSHGDALCTDDKDYQTFRNQVRSPVWRTAFLGKPLAERKAIAAALRRQSEDSKREKQEKARYLMDLNAADTDDFIRHHGYATFIHGHTHQPAVHEHLIDGIHVERWVLSDWHEDRAEYLSWDGERLHRVALPEAS